MKDLIAWVIGIPMALVLLFMCQAGAVIYAIYNGVDWLCNNILKEWKKCSYGSAFLYLIIGAAVMMVVWMMLNESAYEISLFFSNIHFQLGGYIICLFSLAALTISKDIKSNNNNNEEEC